MADAKPPVAIRITRPYQTEDEFLRHERDTISRTGVTLVGAQRRPDGAVLRFEVALASGVPLLRGEGRVVGYREPAHGHEGGLSLRFTRLDSKSKALVDRIAAMPKRSMPPPLPAAARRSVAPPPMPAPPPPPPAPSSDSLNGVPEIPVSSSDVHAVPVPPPEPEPAAEAASEPAAEAASEPAAEAASEPAAEAAPEPAAVSASASVSPDRDATLDRLRKRALDPEAIARILGEGSRRRSG
ncbi:MAG TPA: hypothetical protein VLM85_02305 [Polyangiaceae bacterium]|nr:hypothetical protein [Polyangiaceae bacterium]